MQPESAPRPWKGMILVVAALAVVVAGTLTLLGSQVGAVLSTVGASVGSPIDAGGGQPGNGNGGGGGGGSGENGGSSGGDGAQGGPLQLLDSARPDLLVIKTGELTLQVDAIDPALSAAIRTVDRLGGYVSGSSRSGTGDEASASVTFRIPAASWDDALITLRALPGRVLDERTETDDVTGTVVDLEARIRNLRTTELAVAAIMASAKDIDDVLAVQEKLTDVRGQIEELQSKAAHLREQAALSTLTLHLELTPPPVVDRQQASFDPGAEAEQATARLVAVLQALAKAGIWLAIVWLPFVLALAVAAGLGLFALRRLRGGDGSLGPLEPEQDGA